MATPLNPEYWMHLDLRLDQILNNLQHEQDICMTMFPGNYTSKMDKSRLWGVIVATPLKSGMIFLCGKDVLKGLNKTQLSEM